MSPANGCTHRTRPTFVFHRCFRPCHVPVLACHVKYLGNISYGIVFAGIPLPVISARLAMKNASTCACAGCVGCGAGLAVSGVVVGAPVSVVGRQRRVRAVGRRRPFRRCRASARWADVPAGSLSAVRAPFPGRPGVRSSRYWVIHVQTAVQNTNLGII
jgi:hypothetical protein